MKKIIILSFVTLVSFGANAFAAGSLNSQAVSAAGSAIFGGADGTTAAAMNNRLVSLSKGVEAAVTFTATNNASTGYVIVTKHTSGTKISGTSNDSTKMYWKQAATGDLATGDVPTSDVGATAFAAGSGWTEY